MQNENSHHLELLSKSTFYYVFGTFPGGIAIPQRIQLLDRKVTCLMTTSLRVSPSLFPSLRFCCEKLSCSPKTDPSGLKSTFIDKPLFSQKIKLNPIHDFI